MSEIKQIENIFQALKVLEKKLNRLWRYEIQKPSDSPSSFPQNQRKAQNASLQAGHGQRESGSSKRVIMQVRFRTSQAEALLTLIIVREHWDSIAPLLPCSLPSDPRDPTYIQFQKKGRGEKPQSFQRQQSQVSTPGGTDSLSSLLTATLLRRNQTVNNVTIQRYGSWWSPQEWQTQYYLSSEVVIWKQSQPISFQSNVLLVGINVLARPLKS